MAEIRITLLGGVEVLRDGEAVPLGPPQRRALLAALALRPRRWISASVLLEGLYDGEIPASGANLVQTHISALRRALEPDRAPRAAPAILLSGHGGYQLRIADEDVDVGVFDRLVGEAEKARAQSDWHAADQLYLSALRLCSGDPLAGLPGPAAAAQRVVLQERYLSVLEDSLQVALALGRVDQVVDGARSVLSEHSLRERPTGLLMRALLRQGRRPEALDVYARTYRRFADELGVEPSQELRELQSRILEGRADADTVAESSTSRTPGDGLPRAAMGFSSAAATSHLAGADSGPIDVTPLPVSASSHSADAPSHPADGPVGRAGAASPAAAGPTNAPMTAGGLLVGRDEQLAAILAAHDHAMRGDGGTVVVSGYPGSGKTALIGAAAARIADAVLLAGPGPAREPQLFRALAAAFGIAGQTIEPVPGELAEQVARLRGALESDPRPRAVFIDDLGAEDVELLVALTPVLRRFPVLLVGTLDERSWYPSPVSQAHTTLECLAVEIIRLPALRVTEISMLAGRALGDGSEVLALEIHQATGGLPILVSALLKDMALLDRPVRVPDHLPGGTYLRAVRREMDAYSDAGRRMLGAIAVLQEFDAPLEVVAAACEQPDWEVRERCILLSGQYILESVDPPRLRHALAAGTLRRLSAPETVERLRVLAAQHAQLLSYDTRTIARYLGELSGPQWSQWVPTLLDAAAEAVRVLALPEATAHLEVARRIALPGQRDDILVRLGLLKQWTDPLASHTYLERALEGQRAAKAAPTALIPLAWTLVASSRSQDAEELLDTVIGETEASNPEVALRLRASRWMVTGLTFHAWNAYIERLRREAEPDAASTAILLVDDIMAVRIPAAETAARFPGATDSGAPQRLPPELVGVLAHVALWTDDLTLAGQLSDQSDDKYFGLLDTYRLMFRTEVLLRQARYAEAERTCALVTVQSPGARVRRPPALVALHAHALLGTGRIDEAARWLESTRVHGNPESWEWVTVTYVRALVCAAQGLAREAVGHFLDSGRRLAAWNQLNPAHLPWRSSAALQLVSIGEYDEARRLAAAELELAERWNTPVVLGRAWRAVALAAADHTTVELLGRAVGYLRRAESVTELIAALIDLADTHTEAAAARAVLHEAEALAQARGAGLFVTRITQRLDRLG